MVLIRLVRIASNSHLGIQILPLYQIMRVKCIGILQVLSRHTIKDLSTKVNKWAEHIQY